MSDKREVEMSAKDFAESGRVVHPVLGDSAVSPDGTGYIAFCSSGKKHEGELFDWSNSLREALELWKKAFAVYAADHRQGILFWRHLPEVIEHEGRCTVYARLVLSADRSAS